MQGERDPRKRSDWQSVPESCHSSQRDVTAGRVGAAIGTPVVWDTATG